MILRTGTARIGARANLLDRGNVLGEQIVARHDDECPGLRADQRPVFELLTPDKIQRVSS